MTKKFTFADVLQELELEVVLTDVSDWQFWAEKNDLVLPSSFLEALRLGAAHLLTEHSNAEEFEQPQPLEFFWYFQPVVPLLWENQGSYVYGLHLNGSDDPPVLLCREWKYENQIPVNLRWQPFAENFADFAFARLFDYQYRWLQEDDEKNPLILPPLNEELEAQLNTYFKRGPTTPEVIFSHGTRWRFYRTGQRFSFTQVEPSDPANAYWEWFCATPQASQELLELLIKVMQ